MNSPISNLPIIMGCAKSKNSHPRDNSSSSDVPDLNAVMGLMDFAMRMAGAVLPLGLRLEGAKTRDPEVDAALEDQGKLKAYPEFFARLSAEVGQVDKSAAEELKQLGPGAPLSSAQKASLTAFAEKVKQLGSSSNPPDAKWQRAAQSLVANRQLHEEVLKSYTDLEPDIERESKKADKLNSIKEMRQQVAEMKSSLQDLQGEIKKSKPVLVLKIAAGKAGEAPMAQVKVLNELAAGVEAALKS